MAIQGKRFKQDTVTADGLYPPVSAVEDLFTIGALYGQAFATAYVSAEVVYARRKL